jgi:hypothetical protein
MPKRLPQSIREQAGLCLDDCRPHTNHPRMGNPVANDNLVVVAPFNGHP